MPLTAHFNKKFDTSSLPKQQKEVMVGISLSQEYHKSPDKIAALSELLAQDPFGCVHLMIPGELHAYDLMMDDKSLSIVEARLQGRAMAEKWIKENEPALQKVPHLKIIFFDEVLAYKFDELTEYFKGLRSKQSPSYDPKFEIEYNKTKGLFISHHMSRLAHKGITPDQQEYSRVDSLVEKYIDGELIQLKMWTDQKRPYSHIVYPKEKPPIMQYFYNTYVVPNNPPFFERMFSDLPYAFESKPKKQPKLQPPSPLTQGSSSSLFGKTKAIMMPESTMTPDQVYTGFASQFMEMEAEIDQLHARVLTLQSEIYSLKAKARLCAASGDVGEILTIQNTIVGKMALLKGMRVTLSGGSPSSSDSDDSGLGTSPPKTSPLFPN